MGALGEAWELREVRLALLHERVLALLRLVGQVVEQRRVASELLETGQAVGVGVEGGLQEAERGRALLEDLAGPLDRLVLEPRERDDRVDQPHVERLLGVVLAAEVPDLARLLVAIVRSSSVAP